jgi:secreted trypsin-like serine protease
MRRKTEGAMLGLRIVIGTLAAVSMTPALAIVGGAPPAPENLARSVVMVVGSFGTLCSATVIAPDLLLTVAHCVEPGAEYKLVDAESGQSPVLKDIARIERHPRFELKKLFAHLPTADVALLKLAALLPAEFAPLPLDEETHPATAGDSFTVAGYGVSVHGKNDSGGTLRAATLIALDDPDAAQMRLVDPRTQGKRAGLGACTSDSGAPALRKSDSGLAVVGIVSWSTGPDRHRGCGGMTGVTALARYRDWIAEMARSLRSSLGPAL